MYLTIIGGTKHYHPTFRAAWECLAMQGYDYRMSELHSLDAIRVTRLKDRYTKGCLYYQYATLARCTQGVGYD